VGLLAHHSSPAHWLLNWHLPCLKARCVGEKSLSLALHPPLKLRQHTQLRLTTVSLRFWLSGSGALHPVVTGKPPPWLECFSVPACSIAPTHGPLCSQSAHTPRERRRFRPAQPTVQCAPRC